MAGDKYVHPWDTTPKNQIEIEEVASKKMKRTRIIRYLSYTITILCIITAILSVLFYINNQEGIEKILQYIESKNAGQTFEISDIDEIKNKLNKLKDANILRDINIASKVITTAISAILSWNLFYRLNTVALCG
jgi:predicted PurR-regulated permease PerM